MITAAVRAIAMCAALAGCAGGGPMVAPSTQEHMTREQIGRVAWKFLEMCPTCSRDWFITQEREISGGVNMDGKIVLSGGLMNMLRTPDEFAFVFSHELAHVALKHNDKLMPAHRVGQVVGLFTLGMDYGSYVARSFVQPSFEMEADRQAVQWMTMAGYDARVSLDVVRRVTGPGGMTHPAMADRLRNLEDAIAVSRMAPTQKPAQTYEFKLRE